MYQVNYISVQVKQIHADVINTLNEIRYSSPAAVRVCNRNVGIMNESGLHDLIQIENDGDNHNQDNYIRKNPHIN